MDGALYDVDQLLAVGPYALSSGTVPATGSIVVGNVADLLHYKFLTLRLATGDKLEIIPRRIEHSAGQPAVLIFDVAR